MVLLDFEFVEAEACRAVFAGTPGKRTSDWYIARRLCRLRSASPYYDIAGLYDRGAESGLSQAGYQRHRTLACGGSTAFVQSS